MRNLKIESLPPSKQWVDRGTALLDERKIKEQLKAEEAIERRYNHVLDADAYNKSTNDRTK